MMTEQLRPAPVSRGTWKPFARLARYFRHQQQAAADLETLARADDRQLSDIGVGRTDVMAGYTPGAQDALTGLELLALRK